MTTLKAEFSDARNRVERFFHALGLGAQGKWIVYGVVMGLISGAGAWLFFTSLVWAKFLILGRLAGAPPVEPQGEQLIHQTVSIGFRPWIFFLLPAVGGLLSALVTYLARAPEADGDGTEALIHAFHNQKGNIRTRVPFLKAITALATLASGGSAGREGPIYQIGGGLGSWLARKLDMTVEERRTMLLMGTGGGLGAIFRAPLGGAVTALEVLYREDIETSALLPTVLSSVTAYALFSAIFGYDHVFAMPAFRFTHLKELPVYCLLGLLIMPVGFFYVKFFYAIRDTFRKLKIPKHYKPLIGGLLVGCIGLWFPHVYSGGYGELQRAISGDMAPVFRDALFMMLGLMVYKIMATSFTIGSGGSGGIFGPTLFIGGMLGGAVGLVGHHFWPDVVTQPGAYVVIGMAGLFAGVAKAPIGAMLMTIEMTGGYGLLPPMMLVGVLAILFTRRWSIYEMQVQNRLSSPAHAGDYIVNVLRELTVQDVFEPTEHLMTVPESMPFNEVKSLIASTAHNTFPVVDKNGRFSGVLSLRAARPAIFETGLDALVTAGDISQPAKTVSLSDSLYEALMRFVDADYGQIPVVDPEDSSKILGFFTHEDLMMAYRNEIMRRKEETEGE